ncbi:Pantoate--beta-alanine ligase [Marinobacterium lacunae]|uniref:Pantothenate synthetase n=1 Tax=Marinobacterium lacunae TaxID=1232683 RepID=A0A081G298_9GAMM|nr:pantoate--beta-alanine ligase [Marinobacterium lacunae]KEA64903.1 Pantoate--beta-alanine ligase [Marinobacterium lacunae]
MQTVSTIAELRARLNAERASGKRIALVPTMGNLHRGHLRLVESAVANADFVVASIFVNPLQFGPNEDLERYPRTLAEDQAQLEAFGCNLLFAPTEAEVYPKGRGGQTFVEVPGISDLYCGASRPGHFRGVTTIVNKLFNLIQPDVAVFGCKDYQQLHVIRRMVEDLSMPVELIGVGTERAENGLALSSRNGYLTEEELSVAPALYATLCDLRSALIAGERDHDTLIEHAQNHLERAGFLRDYIHILRRSDMLTADTRDTQLVIIAAAYLGAARLIDNIEVDL